MLREKRSKIEEQVDVIIKLVTCSGAAVDFERGLKRKKDTGNKLNWKGRSSLSQLLLWKDVYVSSSNISRVCPTKCSPARDNVK